jgi:hypothetical protein
VRRSLPAEIGCIASHARTYALMVEHIHTDACLRACVRACVSSLTGVRIVVVCWKQLGRTQPQGRTEQRRRHSCDVVPHLRATGGTRGVLKGHCRVLKGCKG